jgi:hypothetical protein
LSVLEHRSQEASVDGWQYATRILMLDPDLAAAPAAAAGGAPAAAAGAHAGVAQAATAGGVLPEAAAPRAAVAAPYGAAGGDPAGGANSASHGPSPPGALPGGMSGIKTRNVDAVTGATVDTFGVSRGAHVRAVYESSCTG